MKSPSGHIYELYADYERRGLSTKPINDAIARVTGTVGKTNVEVAREWLKECEKNERYAF